MPGTYDREDMLIELRGELEKATDNLAAEINAHKQTANLIAAAPDLLEALTDLVGGCGKEGDLFSGEAMAKARLAIAKAEGGA